MNHNTKIVVLTGCLTFAISLQQAFAFSLPGGGVEKDEIDSQYAECNKDEPSDQPESEHRTTPDFDKYATTQAGVILLKALVTTMEYFGDRPPSSYCEFENVMLSAVAQQNPVQRIKDEIKKELDHLWDWLKRRHPDVSPITFLKCFAKLIQEFISCLNSAGHDNLLGQSELIIARCYATATAALNSDSACR